MPQPGFTPFALVNSSTRYGSSQTISVAVHVTILFALAMLLATHPGNLPPFHPTILRGHDLPRYIPPAPTGVGRPSLGPRAGGGEQEALPATRGSLAPRSSIPLMPPRLTHSDHESLPVAPAVFDPNAPSVAPLITDLGLPWMKKDTNSAGPGKDHGIGSGEHGGMGDDTGDGAGAGDDTGNYANVVSIATCLYCPEPPYTEEARKAKVQGTVLLHALIGADGKARRVQIVKGLSPSLDDRAIEAVRAWRFAPAKNAQRQAMASWATIEMRFQLL